MSRAVSVGAAGGSRPAGAEGIVQVGAERLRRHTMGFSLGYFALCVAGGPAIHYSTAPHIPYWQDPIPYLALALGVAALATYLLARMHHGILAARLLVTAAFVVVWAAVFVTIGSTYATWIPFYLIVAPLLAGFILPWQEVAAVGGAVVLGTAALGLGGVLLLPTAINVAMLSAAVAIVMGTSAAMRRRDERIIHDQAQQLAGHAEDLEQIMVSSSDGLASIDDEGRLVVWNDAATRFMTTFADLQQSDRLGDVLEPVLAGAVESMVQAARAGNPPALAETRLPDGRVVAIIVTALGGGQGSLVTLRDVTTSRDAEQREKERYVQRLEIEKLREVNRFKTNLLNTASHELNTPLTPIRLQLELMRSADRGALTPKQIHSLDILDRNTRRLGDLVQDILDVARMESDRLRIQQGPVAIGSLVRDHVDDFQAAAQRAGVDLRADLDESLWVEGDTRRLGQSVAHLVGNAVKFTTRGGQVTVGCSKEGDQVRVWVQDAGIGFPREKRDMLFQPFSQLHDESRSLGGTGLGLYITKGIIEAHGGTIGIHSDGPEQGAMAWFTLPLMDQDADDAVHVAEMQVQ